jgi:hypothetical protein
MDGWLGEPTDTLHWPFSTELCLFDLEIRLAAPPSSIFFYFSFLLHCSGWREKKETHFPSFLYSSHFFSWFGLVFFHNCCTIIDAFCRNFTYFSYKCGICKIVVQLCTTVERLYAPCSTNFNVSL